MLWNSRHSTRTWNPHFEFERARELMRELIADPITVGNSLPTNVWADERTVRLVALLPGVAPEDVDVTVEGRQLRVAVRRTPADATSDAASPTPKRDSTATDAKPVDGVAAESRTTEPDTWIVRERGAGVVERTFQLPYAVDATKTRATYVNGRLEVELPRIDSEQPRRIDVQRN